MDSSSIPGSISLLDEPDAWSLMLQWATDTITYSQLTETLSSQYGERYIYDEWRDLMTRVFCLSEEEDGAAAREVQDAMQDRGIVLRGATVKGIEGSKRQEKRKVVDGGGMASQRHAKRARKINRFLDVEALVRDGSESSEEEGNSFVDFDENDIPEGPSAPYQRAPIAAPSVVPSRYTKTVDAIAERYSYGADPDLNSSSDGEDEETTELDATGIWNTIREWMFDKLTYETLIRSINSQYKYNAKIQYWEDFLTTLNFESDLRKREQLFQSVSFAEHQERISNYRYSVPVSPVPARPDIRCTLSHSPPVDTPRTKLWAVNVIPPSSAAYIIKAWNAAELPAEAYKILPGRVTVTAPDPRTFIRAVPPSHSACLRGWSLVPLEDSMPYRPAPFEPSIPGWYVITGRSLYRGDIAYGLSFDTESGMLEALVVSRLLNPNRRSDVGIGQDNHTPRLFTPSHFEGESRSSYHRRPCFQFRGKTFVSGLELLSLKISQVTPLKNPTPYRIALHAVSQVDPPFMAATYRSYNQLFWKTGDRVVVSDSVHFQKRGELVEIELENRSALVRLFDGNGEMYDCPLSNLRRLYSLGDVVRVIEDSFSNIQNIYHKYIGRCGMVSCVDFATDEITVTELNNDEFRVPAFLLETYVPDEPVWAPFGVIGPGVNDPSTDSVQVGDTAEVKTGPYAGFAGLVTEVKRLAGTLKIHGYNPISDPNLRAQYIEVPLASISFTVHPRALQFTADRNYNVRKGDFVVVIRGDSMGKSGVVSRVNSDKKTLEVASTVNPSIIFTLPITHFSHPHTVCDSDKSELLRHKEVLIISGPDKGWRGTLCSVGKDTCVVARGASSIGIYPKDAVVVRGMDTTLAGTKLMMPQYRVISAAFEQAEVPDRLDLEVLTDRATPPPDDALGMQDNVPLALPGSPRDPWVIDDNDRAQLTTVAPRSSFEFLLHPDVLKSLETYRAVFKILPGWRDTYTDCLARTELPSPFQGPSGPVSRGHLALRLTSRTRGAQLLVESIPERSLKPYNPVKKNTLCMVTQEKEGGEKMGVILRIEKLHSKKNEVEVIRLDGTMAREGSIPFSRIIAVE